MDVELRCTYRLQLNASFDFNAASDVIDYLSELGISHLYLSPVLQAASASEHGYDGIDPTRVSETLGGEEALQSLLNQLSALGMGALLDIVPNHLAASPENPRWRSVLREGQASPYASFFDIDWDSPDAELKRKILLPILGDHLGKVIAQNEIELVRPEGRSSFLQYHDHELPLNEEGESLIRTGDVDIARLLDLQHYRLAYWRTGSEQINYRRFFDVASLVGVRVEDPDVFHATHQKLFELATSDAVHGFRIDHPDGLRDPMDYFRRLREAVPGLWLLAEKILEPQEKLPESWPIDGTTGYDFLQRVGGLYIDPGGEKALSDFYTEFTGHSEPYGALVRERKRSVLKQAFKAELQRLVEIFRDILQKPTRKLDYPSSILRELLTEVIARFPVYRTYIIHHRKECSEADRQVIHQALASARHRVPPLEDDLLHLLEQVLCDDADVTPQREEFTERFQQLTGPIMAKGVEDTTFYCYDRLLALNEVGSDPAHFGVSLSAFHEACTTTQHTWPKGMLTTSTHDTKRSEDVRARLALISEMPELWAEHVHRWSCHNLSAWAGREPDRNAEHLLYQTLVGAWPIAQERIATYLHKACREAKTHTSWAQPNEPYEQRIQEFAATILNDPTFIQMLESFVKPLVPLGRVNSLSQTLCKLTAPGVPDIYQGCELWDHSLVDPDNRRPVDYETRRALLEELKSGMSAEEIMQRTDEGLPKLHLIHQTLAIRKRYPHAFASGTQAAYRPLLVSGKRLQHILAYSRGAEVAVVTPRLVYSLGSDWEDTQIHLDSRSTWRNAFGGKEYESPISATALFEHFPVALLELIQSTHH